MKRKDRTKPTPLTTGKAQLLIITPAQFKQAVDLLTILGLPATNENVYKVSTTPVIEIGMHQSITDPNYWEKQRRKQAKKNKGRK